MAQKKKIKKKSNYYDLDEKLDDSISVYRIIGTIVGVLVFVAAIYGLTVLLLNKGEKRQPVGEPDIDYQKIVAGSVLNQSEDSYLVLFFSSSDEDIYEAMSEYTAVGKEAIYYVDLKDGLNKYVIAEKTKVNVNDVSELRVKDPTVIKVKSGKIVEDQSGKKKVLDYLK